MKKDLSLKILLIIALVSLSVTFTVLPANTEPAQNKRPAGEWKTADSRFFNIHYRPDADTKKICRKLKRRFFELPGHDRKYFERDDKLLGYRLDVIFRKVEQILGMNPRNLGIIKVYIFKNKTGLENVYYDIFKEREKPVSFYIYKINSLYTSEDNISDSVIAHEVAHAVVDHYFVIRPPEEIKEILSRHVDQYLDE